MRLTSYLLLICLISFTADLFAQKPIEYILAFPNAVHHEAEITVVFPELPAGTFSARMARSSPGRYALHEFAKNVYQVRVTDGAGKTLTYTRPNPHQWDIAGHNGTVKITYTLFADRADGTYAAVDNQHAHLNIPATLMYGNGLENRPATITLQLPNGSNWQAATQLKPTENPFVFTAPHLQYLMDSPIELSAVNMHSWNVTQNGKLQTIRIALHSAATDNVQQDYVNKAKRIVAEAGAVFGGYPNYDFGQYTFLACYVPQAAGDGMEHRNSTFITSSNPLTLNAKGHLGTLSHEFFHSWNVERIRPKSLEPFNFADANMSGELWFAEGFTTYYGDLLLCRAGIDNPQDYARSLTGDLSSVLNSPGRQYFSPVEMSYQAPFVDAAQSIDPVNRSNTYVSYYPYGSVVALALDLTLRSKFKNITLDTYMQAAWKNFGQPEKPYNIPDLENLLATVTKDPAFASDFFRKHIYGKEAADYKTLLAQAGMSLRAANAGKASLGFVSLGFSSNGALLQTSTFVNSPLYRAGLDREDVIQQIDGKKIASLADFRSILNSHKPGDQVTVQFQQRGENKTAQVTLIENPALEVVLFEDAGLTLTKQMKAFRDAWLSGKAR